MAIKDRVIHIKYQRIELVSLTSVMHENIDVCDDELEPFNVLQKKIRAVADALDCDEEEAERIVLNR